LRIDDAENYIAERFDLRPPCQTRVGNELAKLGDSFLGIFVRRHYVTVTAGLARAHDAWPGVHPSLCRLPRFESVPPWTHPHAQPSREIGGDEAYDCRHNRCSRRE